MFLHMLQSLYFSKFLRLELQARYRKEQTLLKQLPCIPLVENLLKDGTDGCALAALIHFYCPDIIKLEGMSAVPLTLATWP